MLDALPFHVILCIADELNVKSVCKLKLVCKALARLVQSREFWNHRAQTRKHASPRCFNDFCAEFPPNTVSPQFLYTNLVYWQTCACHATISIAPKWHISPKAINTVHAAMLTQFSDDLGISIPIGYIISFIDNSGIWTGKLLIAGWANGANPGGYGKEYQAYCNRIISNIDDFLIVPKFLGPDMSRLMHFVMVKKA